MWVKDLHCVCNNKKHAQVALIFFTLAFSFSLSWNLFSVYDLFELYFCSSALLLSSNFAMSSFQNVWQTSFSTLNKCTHPNFSFLIPGLLSLPELLWHITVLLLTILFRVTQRYYWSMRKDIYAFDWQITWHTVKFRKYKLLHDKPPAQTHSAKKPSV